MKTWELREKSKEDLTRLLLEKRSRLDELVALLHERKVKNVKERSAIRRDIARIKTLIREADIGPRKATAIVRPS